MFLIFGSPRQLATAMADLSDPAACVALIRAQRLGR